MNEDKNIIILGIWNIKVGLTKGVLVVSRSSSSRRTKGEKKKSYFLTSLELSET